MVWIIVALIFLGIGATCLLWPKSRVVSISDTETSYAKKLTNDGLTSFPLYGRNKLRLTLSGDWTGTIFFHTITNDKVEEVYMIPQPAGFACLSTHDNGTFSLKHATFDSFALAPFGLTGTVSVVIKAHA